MRQKCVKNASKMRGTPLGENTFWTIPTRSQPKLPLLNFTGIMVAFTSRTSIDNKQGIDQKNPRAHKNKIGTSPPGPQNQIPPPPQTRNFMDLEVFLQKEGIFPGVRKIGAAISGPRIADTNFTDTRIFLIIDAI